MGKRFLYSGKATLSSDAETAGCLKEIFIQHERCLTAAEKKRQLYLRQKKLLETYLKTGAISKDQYDKSLHDMTEKMGYGGELK